MSARRSKKPGARQFTIEQLRDDHARVIKAAKKAGGVIVVDSEGQRRFSLWIPQNTIATD